MDRIAILRLGEGREGAGGGEERGGLVLRF